MRSRTTKTCRTCTATPTSTKPRSRRCCRERAAALTEGTAPRPTWRQQLQELRDRDWVLALSLAFFVAVVVWFARSVQDFFGGSSGDVLLPAFSGQTSADAIGECGRLHLLCTVVARQPSEQYPLDVVMAHEPPS